MFGIFVLEVIVKWKQYEILLCLLQEFWKKQQECMQSIEWYRECIIFLAALTSRLTKWLEKGKWRPALPVEILVKLKEIRRIKYRYYTKRREEDRICLRLKSREVRKEICEYKSSRWNSFLSSIQGSHDKAASAFWKHLSHIYRPPSMPFSKLAVGNKHLTAPMEIVEELYHYYKNLFAQPGTVPGNHHEI
jgi:hypothetical protein